MNRREFILTAAAVPVAAAVPSVESEFEISRPDPDSPREVLRRDLLLEMPWETRAVRWINGREYEWCMITRHRPTDADLSKFRPMLQAAYQRTKTRLGESGNA